MRILIQDFGGYAFPLELSEALSRRGYEVVHMYCASHQTTPPGIQQNDSNSNFQVAPISLSEPLNKYNFVKRWKQERQYGKRVVDQLRNLAPDLVLSANTPLDAQAKLIKACRQQQIPFVFWLQDLLGLAAKRILQQKIPIAGHLIGQYYANMERRLLQQSHHVIAITDGFVQQLANWGIPNTKITVIPNWAPIDQIPVLPKPNQWSKEQNLDQGFCFMYSGTLSMKHNPALLLSLAEAYQDQPNVKVVVVSQGMGANWLKVQKNANKLDNLLILPYQPTERLPEVLASANVLIALLNEEAGAFSVPSKILTYLCAQRPLLLSMPSSNQAAQLVTSAKAGVQVAPEETQSFLYAAHKLFSDPDLCQALGQNARALAEEAFAIEKICDQFEQVIDQISELS